MLKLARNYGLMDEFSGGILTKGVGEVKCL
ncbi:MAG: hypothetical protein ACJAYJ_001467 [Saprospiraceae bacterium]|jgi:hypothetical protein